MRISDYIEPERILLGLPAAPKERLIERLVEVAVASGAKVPREETMRRLLEREQEASTGLGHGVAIPHTVVDGIEGTVVALATVPGGTDFRALDDLPTRVIFLILNPTQKMGAHIRLLARLAGLASHAGVIDAIADARDREEVIALVRADDDRHLAGA